MAEQPTEKPKPVATLWEDWHPRCIRPDAPPVQFHSMRLSFFSGAYSAFEFMKAVSALPEADAERLLSRVQDELDEWRAGLQEQNERRIRDG